MVKTKIYWALLVVCVVVMTAGIIEVYAQDAPAGDAAAAPASSGGLGVWGFLKAGGTVGWFIVLCSVAALAMSIEYIVNIKKEKLCPPATVAEIEALLDEERYEDVIALCEAEPAFLTNMISAAVTKVGAGYDEMEKSMLEVGEYEAFKLNRKISYLSLMGSVAPMLGLLGTVTGMIAAFVVIAETPNPTPKMLATGVFEALVTTCEGLVVAIPSLAAYFFFKNRVSTMILEVSSAAGKIIERFKASNQQ